MILNGSSCLHFVKAGITRVCCSLVILKIRFVCACYVHVGICTCVSAFHACMCVMFVWVSACVSALYAWMRVCMCVYMLAEAGNRYHIPWNLSYRQLLAWMHLETRPKNSINRLPYHPSPYFMTRYQEARGWLTNEMHVSAPPGL